MSRHGQKRRISSAGGTAERVPAFTPMNECGGEGVKETQAQSEREGDKDREGSTPNIAERLLCKLEASLPSFPSHSVREERPLPPFGPLCEQQQRGDPSLANQQRHPSFFSPLPPFLPDFVEGRVRRGKGLSLCRVIQPDPTLGKILQSQSINELP